MKFRIITIFSLFFLLYALLIFNLYNLQLEKGVYYSAQAAIQNLSNGILEAKRGNIYFSDRNQNNIPAALNREFPIIYAAPSEIDDPQEAASMLSSIINIPAGILEKSLYKKNDQYELLMEKSDPQQTSAIQNLNLKGVYVDYKILRFYPFKNLASQLLGFMGINKETNQPTGLYGAELFYNDFLKGKDGRAVGDEIIKPEAGKSINLTVDRNLQSRAEETLESLIQTFQAKSGAIIIQKPKNGEILALANKPDFNPNFYSLANIGFFLNPSLQKIYEPGSVFKVITMAAGIDSGKLTPSTEFIDSGSVKIADRIIKNWDLKAHGKVTMTNVIEKSINTGAVYAEKLIGHDIFYDYLIKFGFGSKTGIDLPGELSGSLKNLVKSPNKDVDFAAASFGQGVAVTPIQLITAMSAIANGGVLMRPYINQSLEPKILGRILSQESAKKVVEMMISAVDKAEVAGISKFNVAGKTGTAQIPDFQRGGYSEKFIHTYVGWVPAFNPAFIILIKLDEPNAELAGLTVVPAFKNLAEFILNYYHIPPDRL